MLIGQPNNIETLRQAVHGHIMEHGIEPTFILMTADVAQAIFHEVSTDTKYRGLIQHGSSPSAPMFFNLGAAGKIEIGQIVGRGRVELVIDAMIKKVRTV